jgi:hypothetical protein
MKRIVCSLLAAGAAAVTAASPANARPREEPRPFERSEYRWRPAAGYRWREIQRARHQFYARWNGNPWERERFERWYAHRCSELRYRGW